MKIKFEWDDCISLNKNLKQPIELRFKDDLKNLLHENIQEVIVLFKQYKPMPTISGVINDMSGKTLYNFMHHPLKNGDTDFTKRE